MLSPRLPSASSIQCPLVSPPSFPPFPFLLFLFSLPFLHLCAGFVRLSRISGSSTSSPPPEFDLLNLTDTIGEYFSSPPFATASQGRPYTPPDNSI
ncbi:hypothetical protein F5141DRAFT_472163 [Pisolithus sp. B1]|nr:hypothetical protein F5141DRAFT_472163 [Pisolithus sp. B1]